MVDAGGEVLVAFAGNLIEAPRVEAVAAAVRAHILQHVLAVLVEDHHGEVLVALHELVGVAGGGHVHRDGVHVVAPHVAHRTPADGHRVVTAHIARCQQQSTALEPRERVEARRLGVVKFHEVGLLDGTGHLFGLLATIDVVGDVLGFPLVLGFVLSGGVADDDGVQRDEGLGQLQDAGDVFAAVLVGESAGPDGAFAGVGGATRQPVAEVNAGEGFQSLFAPPCQSEFLGHCLAILKGQK